MSVTTSAYSGTIAGAFEAALQGIPGIADFHLCSRDAGFRAGRADRRPCRARTSSGGRPSSRRHSECELSSRTGMAEVRFTRQGRRAGKTVLVENLDPRGREYFWLHEELHSRSNDQPAEDPLTDFEAIAAGFVSVTPACTWIARPTPISAASPNGSKASPGREFIFSRVLRPA